MNPTGENENRKDPPPRPGARRDILGVLDGRKERAKYGEAWLDLFLSARREEGTVTARVGNRRVTWGKGQYPSSYRSLARRWGKSLQWVRTFLGKMKRKGLITLSAGSGVSVVTLTGFGDYGYAPAGNDTPAMPPTGMSKGDAAPTTRGNNTSDTLGSNTLNDTLGMLMNSGYEVYVINPGNPSMIFLLKNNTANNTLNCQKVNNMRDFVAQTARPNHKNNTPNKFNYNNLYQNTTHSARKNNTTNDTLNTLTYKLSQENATQCAAGNDTTEEEKKEKGRKENHPLTPLKEKKEKERKRTSGENRTPAREAGNLHEGDGQEEGKASPRGGREDYRAFLDEFFREERRATREVYCMQLGITSATLREKAECVAAEWELTDAVHKDYNDQSKHLLSQIRIKVNEEKRQPSPASRMYGASALPAAGGGKEDCRAFLDRFFAPDADNRAALSAVCMRLGITSATLREKAECVAAEWQVTETRHASYTDWAGHLIKKVKGMVDEERRNKCRARSTPESRAAEVARMIARRHAEEPERERFFQKMREMHMPKA